MDIEIMPSYFPMWLCDMDIESIQILNIRK